MNVEPTKQNYMSTPDPLKKLIDLLPYIARYGISKDEGQAFVNIINEALKSKDKTPQPASQTGVEDAIAIIADYHAYQGARNQWNSDVPILEDRKPSIPEYKAALNTLRSLTAPTTQPASAALEALEALEAVELAISQPTPEHPDTVVIICSKHEAQTIRQALAQCGVHDWYDHAHKNHMEFLRKAQKKGKLTTEEEICNFLAAAAAGEAGELLNLHKKQWRGDDIDISEKARMEAADIYIYLRHYARHMGFDLDKAAADKVEIVKQRLAAAPVAGKGG